jgi:hypothetical protein
MTVYTWGEILHNRSVMFACVYSMTFLQGPIPLPMLNPFSMSDYNLLIWPCSCLISTTYHEISSAFQLAATTWARRAAAPLHASIVKIAFNIQINLLAKKIVLLPM